MNAEDAMDDISLLLIAKWSATLAQIRGLPEARVRPAT